jgi:uncharacterized protein
MAFQAESMTISFCINLTIPALTACSLRISHFSILLSHAPEVYRQAAHADFNLMLSGHTHGGQICLPRSIPIKLDAVLPRRMGPELGNITTHTGYTSVGAGPSVLPVHLNFPPEITLHCLRGER